MDEQEAKGPAWGYSKDGAKLFEDGIRSEGYYDTPAHPALVGGDQDGNGERDALVAEAEALGIEVSGRTGRPWGIQRLRDEIERAKEPTADEPVSEMPSEEPEPVE